MTSGDKIMTLKTKDTAYDIMRLVRLVNSSDDMEALVENALDVEGSFVISINNK